VLFEIHYPVEKRTLDFSIAFHFDHELFQK